jgi:opacity protein-like surface antigen
MQSGFASGWSEIELSVSIRQTRKASRDIIGVQMKKIILATVLAGLGSTSALAADLGARTYTKAPVMAEAAYNWTGFYIGGDIGAANPSHDFTSNFMQNGTTRANNVQHNSFSGASFTGGVHAGYNWQFAPNLVAGVEGDWQWVRSSQSFCRQTHRARAPRLDHRSIDVLWHRRRRVCQHKKFVVLELFGRRLR